MSRSRIGGAAVSADVVASSRLLRRLFLTADERDLVSSLESGLVGVEDRLRYEAASAEVVDPGVVRYLVDAGGKRVRPVLALLTSLLGDGVSAEVIDGATALELTHVATLYHDDVMDEAELRRGVPSANRLWGNNVAILAGDVLSARAYLLMARMRPDLMALHASTFARLVTGQLNETLGPRDGDDPIEHYLQVLADKTGSLIACAAEFGLALGNGPAEFSPALRDFGERIGVAFQLVDDVIDLRSTEQELGKQPGTDLREGVPTLPMLLLRERAKTSAADAAAVAAIEVDLATEATVPRALSLLADHEVTAETLARALDLSQQAKEALVVLPSGPVRGALERFADYLVERSN